MTKKKNDVRMIAFNNGVSAVCQYKVQVPVANVDLIYTPTDGLIEEYMSVFVEETKMAKQVKEEKLEKVEV